MIIQEYLNTLINSRRYELMNVNEGFIKNIYYKNKEIYTTFKKLYEKAKQTKKEEDIKKAIDYYKNNETILYKNFIGTLKWYNELNVLLEKINTEKAIESNRPPKKFTVQEIESHLKNIINKFKKDPECIKDLNKYNAKLICNLIEQFGSDIVYQIIDGNQKSCSTGEPLFKWCYKIGKELEDELEIYVNYIDEEGYDGCICVHY